MSEAVINRTEELMQRDAEIERLKKRISELETADMFWLEEAPEEGAEYSAAEAVNIYYGNCRSLEGPVEVRRAVSLENIWVVLEGNGNKIIENMFHTKEEAEQFYQKMRGENHD